MSKFRKKPVVIEAIRWEGHNWNEVCDFMPVPEVAHGDDSTTADGVMDILITTLEGEMRCSLGDWIIRGVSGEFYPCKDEIFRKTYEPA